MATFRVFPCPTTLDGNPKPFLVEGRAAARSACMRALGLPVKDAAARRVIRCAAQETFTHPNGASAAFRAVAAR